MSSVRSFYFFILQFALLMGLWLILTEGTEQTYLFGLSVVLLAMGAYLILPAHPTYRVSLWGLLHFTLYFLKESLLGSVDVAYRTLHPKLPIKPDWHHYKPKLAPGLPRWLFINTISLLPGTLSADYDEANNMLYIHALNADNDMDRALNSLQNRIIRLFPNAVITEADA